MQFEPNKLLHNGKQKSFDYNLPTEFVQEVKQNDLEQQRPIRKHRNPLEQDRNALRNKIETDFLKWKGDLEQQVEVKLCRELMSMCFNCSGDFSPWFQRLQPICCRLGCANKKTKYNILTFLVILVDPDYAQD